MDKITQFQVVVFLLGVLALVEANRTFAQGSGKASRPNLILITADDMNWDSVGIYGSPMKNPTPNLDR